MTERHETIIEHVVRCKRPIVTLIPFPASRSRRGCGRSGSSRTMIGRSGAECRPSSCGNEVNEASASLTSSIAAALREFHAHGREVSVSDS